MDGDLALVDELGRAVAATVSAAFWMRSPLEPVAHAYEYHRGKGPYLVPVCRGASARHDRAEWDLVPRPRYPHCQSCESDLAVRRSKAAV